MVSTMRFVHLYSVRTHMSARVVCFLGMYVAASLVLGTLLLLQVWPWQPKTIVGWLALLLLALPITAAGEWLGNLILENRFAGSLGRNTAGDSVAWLRVAYGVAALLLIYAVGGAIYVAVWALLR